MSDLPRRHFLASGAAFAAATTATLVGSRETEAGDPSFMNDEKSENKVVGNTVSNNSKTCMDDLSIAVPIFEGAGARRCRSL